METFERILIGTFCWPFEALFAMWGLYLLDHEGFNVPTPGYLSCFLVSLGFEMLLTAATLTRQVREQRLRDT